MAHRDRLHEGEAAFVAAIALVAGPAAAGSLTEQSVAVTSLATPLPVVVYTPDGAPPAAGWPVLYLLHGHDGDARSWSDLGEIGPTLDRMIAQGEIIPLLVVMPGADNSWYVDSAAPGGRGILRRR